MKINELLDETKWELLVNNVDLNKEVHGCFSGDLLSWVMANGETDQAWVTVQGHLNVIAVAVLCEFSCVIVAHGAVVEQDVIDKAQSENLILIRSSLSSYEVVKKLVALGV